jgi:phosphate transport system substrate-binding protein
MITRRSLLIACLSALAWGTGVRAARGASDKQLSGAGATFPLPFYHLLFDAYARQRGVQVDYRGIGSGGGIRQLLERKVDFAGTDSFMNQDELREAGAPVVHVPTCLGGVALTYNIPGNPSIRFTPDLIADVFLGKIRRWNDSRLAEVNPDVRLPDLGISVIVRADSSGTTFILTEYLSKVSAEWGKRLGTGRSIAWPVGTGANGNPGVAGLIKQRPGAFGYVELIYALANELPAASVRNRSGHFAAPTTDTVSLAAAVALPDDMNVSLTDTAAAAGYPVSSFTYVILYREQRYDGRSRARAETLANLLWWMIHEGQRHTRPLHYAPIPEPAVVKVEALLRSLTYDGQPILRDR